jgi:hypothetical protein
MQLNQKLRNSLIDMELYRLWRQSQNRSHFQAVFCSLAKGGVKTPSNKG